MAFQRGPRATSRQAGLVRAPLQRGRARERAPSPPLPLLPTPRFRGSTPPPFSHRSSLSLPWRAAATVGRGRGGRGRAGSRVRARVPGAGADAAVAAAAAPVSGAGAGAASVAAAAAVRNVWVRQASVRPPGDAIAADGVSAGPAGDFAPGRACPRTSPARARARAPLPTVAPPFHSSFPWLHPSTLQPPLFIVFALACRRDCRARSRGSRPSGFARPRARARGWR